MTKIQKLEQQVLELTKESKQIKKDLQNSIEEHNIAFQENDTLKQNLLLAKTSLGVANERIEQLEEEVKDLVIDFEDPNECAKRIRTMMIGKKWSKISEFTKQLVANVHADLKEITTRQRNNLLFNQKQLDNLNGICKDISQDTVSFEGR